MEIGVAEYASDRLLKAFIGGDRLTEGIAIEPGELALISALKPLGLGAAIGQRGF